MSYLLLWDRWKFESYEALCATPQWVIDDMMLVMEVEARVSKEPDARK